MCFRVLSGALVGFIAVPFDMVGVCSIRGWVAIVNHYKCEILFFLDGGAVFVVGNCRVRVGGVNVASKILKVGGDCLPVSGLVKNKMCGSVMRLYRPLRFSKSV